MAAVDDQEVKFQQAKAFLMQADAEGRSVYDHLHNVVYSMLEENPMDIVHHPERFAELSSAIRKHQFVHGDASNSANEAPTVHVTQTTRADENKKLFQKAEPVMTTKIEQPTPYTTVTTTTVEPRKAPPVQSVVKENAMWRHCGSGLPEAEAFLLDQSIAKLAMDKNLEEVRFVGKIFGTRANYLVVSSKRYVGEAENVYEEVNTMPKAPRKKVAVDVQEEPGFKGCNRLSFWVAPYAAASWTLLPDVTPQEINATRKVKKMFTGELSSPVVAYPDFEGSEAVYLRAQLSRIVSSTFISPVGALERVEPEEDEEEDDEEEEAKKGPKAAKYWPLYKASEEYAPDEEAGVVPLVDLEQWGHSEGYIYETGRQTKVPPKPETEDEEEEEPADEDEEEEEEKEEEERELFQPLKQDHLFAVIDIPREPNPEDEEEEEPADEDEGEGEEKEEEEENKPLLDEDVPDDDPLKKKITSWTASLANGLYKKHAVAVLKSMRWPGAIAYSGQGGKTFGAVYFGNGLKSADHAFTPVPAPPILKEVDDLTEIMDPTAATEKLVLRGEEPKEDSEDEKEEEEEEEEA